jgi:hypothetical protein
VVTHEVEDRRTVVFRECGAGACVVIATGYMATVLATEPHRRALLLAVVCAVVSALCSDWTARVAAAGSGSLAFIVWLGHAQMPAPWEVTPLFGFAVLLGAGYRRILRDSRVEQE